MNRKKKTLQELASDLKGDVNSLIWDYALPMSEIDFKILYNLMHYIDVFLLECFDKNGKLSNKKWIQKKLITCVIYLGASKCTELHRIMDKVINLENEIYLEEIPVNGNQDSNS